MNKQIKNKHLHFITSLLKPGDYVLCSDYKQEYEIKYVSYKSHTITINAYEQLDGTLVGQTVLVKDIISINGKNVNDILELKSSNEEYFFKFRIKNLLEGFWVSRREFYLETKEKLQVKDISKEHFSNIMLKNINPDNSFEKEAKLLLIDAYLFYKSFNKFLNNKGL